MKETKLIKVFSLYVDGKAVDVPKKPTWNGDLVPYEKGMEVRIGKSVPGKELTWIRLQDSEGNEILLCDRCLMNCISRNDCKSLIGYEIEEDRIHAAVDLPTVGMSQKDDCDWTRALAAVEDDSLLHWQGIFSLGKETFEKFDEKMISLRGDSSALNWDYYASYDYDINFGWRPVLRILDTKQDSWIPVEEFLPDERTEVQVTYLGYYDKKPYCNQFAFLDNKEWYWSPDCEPVTVPIVAWKPVCEPYHPAVSTQSSKNLADAEISSCWYTESWSMDDLKNSLEDNHIPVTKENLEKAWAVVKKEHLFEDVSDRRELLDRVICRHFK